MPNYSRIPFSELYPTSVNTASSGPLEFTEQQFDDKCSVEQLLHQIFIEILEVSKTREIHEIRIDGSRVLYMELLRD